MQFPAPPWTGCLGKSHNRSVPRFAPPENGNKNGGGSKAVLAAPGVLLKEQTVYFQGEIIS